MSVTNKNKWSNFSSTVDVTMDLNDLLEEHNGNEFDQINFDELDVAAPTTMSKPCEIVIEVPSAPLEDIASTNNLSHRNCNKTAENSEKYNDILRKLNKISQNQEIILETLSKICNEHSLKACKMSETNNVEDDVLNSGMPFKQWNEVELFEKKLESKSYFKNIVFALSLIGGTDTQNIIVNVLKRLLTDSLAEKYSFLGARSSKLSFKNSMMYRIILEIVRNHNKMEKEIKINDVISKWLVQAKTRKERGTIKILRKKTRLALLTNQDENTFVEQNYSSSNESNMSVLSSF